MYPVRALDSLFYGATHRSRAERGLSPYRNVLIIGAGSGNDVSLALARGAAHVDAVEIDPVIAQYGREHHPSRPYDDPRVNLVVDDGRAFMTRTERRYDLIIFALTDSLVKVSPMAQLRLENYLFTPGVGRPRLGAPRGRRGLVFYNFYRQAWLIEKIRSMVTQATGVEPTEALRMGQLSVLITNRASPTPPAPSGAVEVPTDDWPFLYLRERAIPAVYRGVMLGLTVVVALLMVGLQLTGRRSEAGTVSLKVAFVLMGVAFLLLETKSVIQFSLLFGTTWYNNSLVFLGILLLVLAANLTVSSMKGRTYLKTTYVLLIASCLLGWLYPEGNLPRREQRSLALPGGQPPHLRADLLRQPALQHDLPRPAGGRGPVRLEPPGSDAGRHRRVQQHGPWLRRPGPGGCRLLHARLRPPPLGQENGRPN